MPVASAHFFQALLRCNWQITLCITTSGWSFVFYIVNCNSNGGKIVRTPDFVAKSYESMGNLGDGYLQIAPEVRTVLWAELLNLWCLTLGSQCQKTCRRPSWCQRVGKVVLEKITGIWCHEGKKHSGLYKTLQLTSNYTFNKFQVEIIWPHIHSPHPATRIINFFKDKLILCLWWEISPDPSSSKFTFLSLIFLFLIMYL